MSQITIAGGGFAGVWAAIAAAATRARRKADAIHIQLISREANLCIRPRLYQGARPDMLVPLQPILEKVGVGFVQGDITGLTDNKSTLQEGRRLDHNRLVLALGSHVPLPGIPLEGQGAFTVDDYIQTARLDLHLESISDEATVVIVGASFSGLEIATELRRRLGDMAMIVLVDQASEAGQSLGENVKDHVAAALRRNGVTFRGGDTVVEVTPDDVVLASGNRIATGTVVFATGLRPSPLTKGLGAVRDDGRLQVDDVLRVPERPAIFAAGDVAAAWADGAHQTLMSCQHAMPMGLIAGQNAVLDLIGADLLTYRQPDYATCLSLGDEAVFTEGWDRKIVMTGAEGAAMKTRINETWIYPPSAELSPDEIFDAVLSPAG